MMEEGLLEEARRVYPYRAYNSLNTVGYKELLIISTELELDFALEKIKRNSRVYAKKQLTWFKKDSEMKWVNLSSDPESPIDFVAAVSAPLFVSNLATLM